MKDIPPLSVFRIKQYSIYTFHNNAIHRKGRKETLFREVEYYPEDNDNESVGFIGPEN